MPENKIIISGTGCALVDFLYLNISFHSEEFKKYLSNKAGDGGLSPGKLVFIEELEKYSGKSHYKILEEITNGSFPTSINIGGPGLVPLIHAAQFLEKSEFSVKFYGYSGNDKISELLTELLDKTPLDITNYIAASEKPTPSTDVFSDPDYDKGQGERTFLNNIGAAWDYSKENLPDEFFNSHIVCFGGTALVPLIHECLTELLKRAKKNNCITVVNTVYDFRSERSNPGEKWPLGNTFESLGLIDILIMDKEEALKISGQLTVESAASYFQSHKVSSFVITNGAEKITAFSNGSFFNQMEISTFPVSAKVTQYSVRKGDTTGCGDNFTGGLIASVAEQLKLNRYGPFDFREALSWAVASGGFACSYVGGTFLEKVEGEKFKIVQEFKNEYVRQISSL